MTEAQFHSIREKTLFRIHEIDTLSRRLKEVTQKHLKFLQSDYFRKSKLRDDELYKQLEIESKKAGMDIEEYIRDKPAWRKFYVETLFRNFGYIAIKEEAEMFKSKYPNMIISAVLLLSFSYFEQSLKFLCDNLSEVEGARLRSSDLKGDVLDKFKTYFLKVLDLDLGFSKSYEWKTLNIFKEIRNIIVHNGSVYEKSNHSKEIQTYIQKNDKIRLNDNSEFIFEYEIISDFVEVIENFYLAVFSNIYQFKIKHEGVL